LPLGHIPGKVLLARRRREAKFRVTPQLAQQETAASLTASSSSLQPTNNILYNLLKQPDRISF
jgi:hypothetical protein